MAWIESHQELAHHPKVARLAGLLQIEKAAAIGYLHMLWWWCLAYAEDGDVSQFSNIELADGAQWRGDSDAFVGCLMDSGWLDDGQVHDWHDYGGKLAERRREDAARKRIDRAAASVDRPPDDLADGVRRQQQTTEQQKTATAAESNGFVAFNAKRAADEVKQRKKAGLLVKTDGGLARHIAADPEHLAESKRLWNHRECETCKGKGSKSVYGAGSGMVDVPCEEAV
jgi:hypothetical protein